MLCFVCGWKDSWLRCRVATIWHLIKIAASHAGNLTAHSLLIPIKIYSHLRWFRMTCLQLLGKFACISWKRSFKITSYHWSPASKCHLDHFLLPSSTTLRTTNSQRCLILICHDILQIRAVYHSLYLPVTIWVEASQHNASDIHLAHSLLRVSIKWAAQYFLPSLEANQVEFKLLRSQCKRVLIIHPEWCADHQETTTLVGHSLSPFWCLCQKLSLSFFSVIKFLPHKYLKPGSLPQS